MTQDSHDEQNCEEYLEEVLFEISAEFVIEVHDEILKLTTGLEGCNLDKLESALGRIEQRMHYAGVSDVFEIAAWYGIAIAKGHAFSDGNKRTGLAVMLTYLDMQGFTIQENRHLDDMMVSIVNDQTDHGDLALLLSAYLTTLVVE